MGKRTTVGLIIVAALALVLGGCAVLEPEMSYQGQLTDNAGSTVPDGNYQMTFRLYDEVDDTVGNALWTENQTVAVSGGLFNVTLGEVTDIDTSTFAQKLWLGVEVEGDGEMTPRQELTGAPFAMSLAPGAAMQGTVNFTDELPGMLNIRNSGTGTGVSVNHWGVTGLAITGAFDPTASDPVAVGDYGLTIEAVQHGAAITATNGLGLKAISEGGAADDWWGLYGIGYANNGGDGVFGWGHGTEDDATGLTGRADQGRAIYGFTDGVGQYAGYFNDPIYVNGGCTGCSARYVAYNDASITLQPGDAVRAAGASFVEGMDSPIMNVLPAGGRDTILGVVVGRTEMTVVGPGLDDVAPGAQFGPVSGEAAPGDYLVIVVQGPAQVKAGPAAGIQAGDMVYFGADGLTTDAGGPAIGMALDGVDAAGLVWVLVGFH